MVGDVWGRGGCVEAPEHAGWDRSSAETVKEGGGRELNACERMTVPCIKARRSMRGMLSSGCRDTAKQACPRGCHTPAS